MSCAKTDEPIDAFWEVDSSWSKEAHIRWGAHWRHLANMTEPSMCGRDAAFLPNYFDHLSGSGPKNLCYLSPKVCFLGGSLA